VSQCVLPASASATQECSPSDQVAPAAQAGLRPGDLVLDVGRQPMQDAQGIQRQLFGEAIGVPLPVTVLRNGAMVDVVAVPTELAPR
jgi:serine protease Do